MSIHKQIAEKSNPRESHHQNYVEINTLFTRDIKQLIYREIWNHVHWYEIYKRANHVQRSPDIAS